MITQMSLFYPSVEKGRKAVDTLADYLLKNEVLQLPLPEFQLPEKLFETQTSSFSHSDAQIPNLDEIIRLESEISGGFRVGHPTHLDVTEPELISNAQKILQHAELPASANPYYRMQDKFTGGRVCDPDQARIPGTPQWLYTQGIRSLHVQSQQRGIPGYWIIIAFRSDRNGQRLAKNVRQSLRNKTLKPVSSSVKQSGQLSYSQLNTVKGIALLMEPEVLEQYADVLFHILRILATIRPQEFADRLVYVWEELMRHYTTIDDLDKAVICLETQASLDPTASDSWLNLGFVYNSFKYPGKALETYLEGVHRFPDDEYLHHNLASLLMDLGHQTKALGFLNEAILANPERAVNYKLKGDIHVRRKELQAATNAYRQAVSMMHDEADWFKEECVSCLAHCLETQGKSDHAAALRSAFQAGNDLSTVLRHLDKDLLAFFPTEGRSIEELEAILLKVVPLITSEYLDFFTESDTVPLETYANLKGRILVLRQEAMKPDYKKPSFQLWRCLRGVGAKKKESGKNINAECLADGEKASWDVNKWLGVLRPEKLIRAEKLLGKKLKPLEKT